jgi:hypothetical protein
MVKLSGFFKNISIILLAICLLFVYAFLRNNIVGIIFNWQGEQLYSISRNQFFYFCLATAIIYHILFHQFKTAYLLTKKSVDADQFHQDYRKILLTWWNITGLTVNLFFICFLIFTALANNAEDFKFSSITLLPMIGVTPLILSVLALPFIFIIRQREQKLHHS